MSSAATDLAGVIALMRCALGAPPAAQDLLALTAADPAGIVGIASAHAVMPLLAAACDDPTVREHIPADLTLFLQSMRERNATRNAALEDQLIELGGAFAAAGFHGVVLKGGAELLTPLYPQGGRFVLDLDILVALDRLDEAARICQALGYAFMAEEAQYTHEHHLPALLHPQRPAPVELHRRISSGRGDAVLPANFIIQRACPSGVAGLHVPSLADRMLHVIVHAQAEVPPGRFNPLRLRDFSDMALMSRKLDAADRTFVRTRCEAHGLGVECAGMLAVLREMFCKGPSHQPESAQAHLWSANALALLVAPRLQRRQHVLYWSKHYAVGLMRDPLARRRFWRRLFSPSYLVKFARMHANSYLNIR